MRLRATVALLGYGTTEGALKGWDTRGRTNHPEYNNGVHLGIFDRPERANQHAQSVSRIFSHPFPPLAERERIARVFRGAVLLGEQDVQMNTLTPLQATITMKRLKRAEGNKNEKLPSVFFYEGKRYILDGHHRLALAALRGEKSIRAKVYTAVPSYK